MYTTFFSSRLSNFFGNLSPYRCARNFDRHCEVQFFFNLSVLWNYFAHTYSFFDNTSLTVCEKNDLPLLGFSSNIFTFDHLFSHRLVVFNNLAIFVKTKWPEDHKNRYRSFGTNSVGLQFQIKIKKIKENGKNKKIENLQNGQEKNGGKIPANVYIWGKI